MARTESKHRPEDAAREDSCGAIGAVAGRCLLREGEGFTIRLCLAIISTVIRISFIIQSTCAFSIGPVSV